MSVIALRAGAAACTVLAAVSLLLACAQASGVEGALRPESVACAADRECGSGFCDDGACRQPEGVLGSACTVAPRGPDGLRDAKLHSCGAYVCSDARCRSCVSDAQCQSELGAPRCAASPGRPGLRCGR